MLAVRNVWKTYVVSPLLIEIRQSVLLILIFAISKASVEHEVVGTRGKDVVLQCLLNISITLPEWQGPINYTTYNDLGSPSFFGNANSVLENRLKWSDNQNDLVIHNVQKSDEGKYQCLMYGLGEYKIKLVITEPVEDVNTTPGLVSTSVSGYTGAIVAVVILVFWIICTIGIVVVKYCKCKFLTDMAHRKSDTNYGLGADAESAEQGTSEQLLQTNNAEIEMKPQQKTAVVAPYNTVVETVLTKEDNGPSASETSENHKCKSPKIGPSRSMQSKFAKLFMPKWKQSSEKSTTVPMAVIQPETLEVDFSDGCDEPKDVMMLKYGNGNIPNNDNELTSMSQNGVLEHETTTKRHEKSEYKQKPVIEVQPMMAPTPPVNAKTSQVVKKNIKPFRALSMDELVEWLNICRMCDLADICGREGLNGEFMMHLTLEHLEKPPFNLNSFQIVKFKIIKDGWCPT